MWQAYLRLAEAQVSAVDCCNPGSSPTGKAACLVFQNTYALSPSLNKAQSETELQEIPSVMLPS